MSENKDDFHDIISSNHGLFDAHNATLDDALGHIDGVKVGVQQEGVAFEVTCHGCRAATRLTVEYPEIIALAFNVSPSVAFAHRSQALPDPRSILHDKPSTWEPVPGKGAWQCQERCPSSSCRWNLRIELSVTEPQQYLRRAKAQGYIDPNMERAVAHHCRALQQQHAVQYRRR
jgi:hypothetical protein